MTAQSIETSSPLAARNADLVRQGYAAFNAGDLETLTRLFNETAAWHTPGRGVLASDRRGRDAVLGHFGRYAAETAGTFRAELRYVTADDEGRVIAMHHNTAERQGKRLDVDCCIVFAIEDGRVTEGREYFYDLHAWDEFWS